MLRDRCLVAAECKFVDLAFELGKKLLSGTHYRIEKGGKLLYQITLDNELEIRRNSAFATDLCVFEEKLKRQDDAAREAMISIPRVVMEFKTSITTHDVLTYSAKAKLHKQVYPYLRYGMVASQNSKVPGLFFTHNDALDFCATLGGLDEAFESFFADLLHSEIAWSEKLEQITFGQSKTISRLYQNVPVFDYGLHNHGTLAGRQLAPPGTAAVATSATDSNQGIESSASSASASMC